MENMYAHVCQKKANRPDQPEQRNALPCGYLSIRNLSWGRESCGGTHGKHIHKYRRLCLSHLCRRGQGGFRGLLYFCTPRREGKRKRCRNQKADAKGHPEEASCLRSKPPCEPLISQEGKQQQYGHLQGEPQHPETDAFQHYDSSPRSSNARISSKSSLLRGWDCTSAAIRDFGEFRYSFSTKVSVSAAR